jgi:hypothetical protein
MKMENLEKSKEDLYVILSFKQSFEDITRLMYR